jgi:molecular chaperone GrpE (heat shock protein)
LPKLLGQIREFIRDRQAGSRSSSATSDPNAGPIAELNKALRSASTTVRETIIQLQKLERQHHLLQGYGSTAWREYEALLSRYHELIRSVLRVIDDCERVQQSSPEVSALLEGLGKIVAEQDIEAMQVNPGDVFDAELHICEEMVERAGHPDGVIVEVLETGYLKKYDNGTRAVLRPAKVLANKIPHGGASL